MVTQVITLDNHGEQKSISKCTAHQTLMQFGDNSKKITSGSPKLDRLRLEKDQTTVSPIFNCPVLSNQVPRQVPGTLREAGIRNYNQT